jgi:hypothetical protein
MEGQQQLRPVAIKLIRPDKAPPEERREEKAKGEKR